MNTTERYYNPNPNPAVLHCTYLRVLRPAGEQGVDRPGSDKPDRQVLRAMLPAVASIALQADSLQPHPSNTRHQHLVNRSLGHAPHPSQKNSSKSVHSSLSSLANGHAKKRAKMKRNY